VLPVYMPAWYFAALLFALAAVAFVAVFLLITLRRTAQAANSLNNLIVAAFCVINLGVTWLALHPSAITGNTWTAIELVCDRVGLVLIMLGLTLFSSLWVFARIRRSA